MAMHVVRAIREGEEMFWLTESYSLSDFQEDYGKGDFDCLQLVEIHAVILTEAQEEMFQALKLISHATNCPQSIDDMLQAIFEAGFRAARDR